MNVLVASWLLLFQAPAHCAPTAAPALALPSAEEITFLLEPIRERRGLPALAAALSTGAGEIAVGCVGVREQGNPTPVTPEDKFHLGSCTKSMTATLAGVLVERGELSWDTTLGEVFGERVEGMHPDWTGVTLELLLAHRAGLLRDPSPVWRQAPPRELREEIAAALLREPPERAPDTETCYSNAGYVLAGALLEAVMDRSWEDLMRAELFTPLGMTSAGFGAPDSKEQGDPLQPRGHLPNGDPIRGWDNLAYYGPAGTVHASLGDWSRYVIQHLRAARGPGGDGGDGGEDLLLEPETFARLQTSHGGDYALGWGVTARGWAGLEGEGHVLTHAGSNTRWYCVAWLAPERNLAALAATNWAGEEARVACDEAVGALIEEALGLGAPLPAAAPLAVSFATSDGGTIHADLYEPEGDGSGRGVVLAHGGQFDKQSWQEQARALAAEGFSVLAIDFRGYGQSIGPGHQDPLGAPLELDVLGAVRYLRTRGADSVSVVGASMGGTAAAAAAIAAESGEIERLVLLGAWASGPPEELPGRKLFAVSRGDTRGDGVVRLDRIREQHERAPPPKELLILEGSAHAQFLFATPEGPRLTSAIVRFLTEP